MLKKSINRIIAVLSIFVLLLTSLPLTVFAENLTNSAENEDEYIYNSDLFFGYSTYLTEAPLLSLEQYRKQTTYNIINYDYIKSNHFYVSVVSEGLSIATDPAGTVKYFTDYVGTTNFQFNDELDKANVSFVKKLCETNLLLGEAQSIIKENNKYIKKMNGFLKAVQSIEKAGLLDEAYYKNLDEAEIYSTMYEQSIAYYKEYFTQISPDLSFNTQLHTALSEVTSTLGGIATAAEFTQALFLSLLMQDAQIELIQEIIDTQPSTSTLYKGLSRLKNQLKGGWRSYFIDTFVKGKVYEQITGEISDKITDWIMGDWTSYYSAVTAVVKVVNMVVFEWILGADYDAYRSALMLDTYASDLCDSVKNKALTFQNSNFTTKDIEKYEQLFNAYIAMSKASLDACQDLAIHNATYTKTYLDEQLKLYDNDNIYTDYLNDVKNSIASIPKENRILTRYGVWTLSGDTVVCGGSDKIQNGYIYTVDNKFNGTIKSTGYGHNFAVAENQKVSISGDLDLTSCNSSNATEYYSVISVPKSSELTINGNLYHNCYDASGAQSAVFYNYGKIKVNGRVSMSGCYSYYFGGDAHANFWNYGTFEVGEGLLLNQTNGTFYNYGEVIVNKNIEIRDRGTLLNKGGIYAGSLILNSCYTGGTKQYSYLKMYDSSAHIELTGDFLNNGSGNLSYCEITDGTVVFSGTEQQEIKSVNIKNIDVCNPEGIKYLSDLYLYGEYKLNGNPLDNNGHITQCYTGASFGDDSDYKELYIVYKNTVTLDQSICGNFSGGQGGGLLIPADAEVVIDGSVNLGFGKVINNGKLTVAKVLRVYGKNSGIKNNGELHALTDLLLGKDTNGDYGYLEMSNISANISVGGDFSLPYGFCGKISNGKMIFNGSSKQSVAGLAAPIIILENKSTEGVVFTSAITSSVLFNHNGNKFTLYNDGVGSSFVDYDGDGLKDNIDPEPTVGKPCRVLFESEDIEKGTVSLGEVETFGGTKLTVTATPTFKYNFSKWVDSSGTVVSTSSQYTLIVKNDETFKAIFVKRKRPIFIRTNGGEIISPLFAEIDSEVTVSVAENDGYVYTEGSLAYNGIAIKNNKFIMPDELVTLTAEFIRNENYFSLADAINSAKSYTYENYTKESFENLTTAINAAQRVLVNNITAEESCKYIKLLQSAVDGLKDKYISSIALKWSPTLYVDVPDMINSISIIVTYDNGTTINATGADCVIGGYDPSVLGNQTITVTYNGFVGELNVTVQKRRIFECGISNVTDCVYDGIKDEYTQVPTVVYYRTKETLVKDADYTVTYANNSGIGKATITITGIGSYTGSRTISYNIYCQHNYEIFDRVEATCVKTGYLTEKCSICKKIISYENTFTENLPESEHNYGNNADVSYYYTCDEASSLKLTFSSSTMLESNYDFIYIYNAAGTLLGTYSGDSLSGKSIEVSGNTVRIRLKSDGSVVKYGFSLDSITAYFDELLLPMIEHKYGEWSTIVEATPDSTGLKHKVCLECGHEVTEKVPVVNGLAFSGASLSLHHNLAINYKVNKALFESIGYANPYVVFEIGGKKVTVKNYSVEGDRYVFRFNNIAPNQMNDTIFATLYARYNGTEYASETKEYSVAEYCYNTLSKYNADSYAKLRTLIVDLLNYGAQSQLYTKYKTDNLANGNLTAAESAWGTAEEPILKNSLNIAYKTVDNPLITWKGASLSLNDSVAMKFKFITDDINGLSLKISSEKGEWNIKASSFVLENGVYSVKFSGLNAGQMSEKVYLTMYKDGIAVSNTVCYSIESYAYSKQSSQIEHLADLVKAMMKYGDSAYSYVN